MQGELGATSDQISWVLTSYLVSSAIVMPLTGYFADMLGPQALPACICIARLRGRLRAVRHLAESRRRSSCFRLLQGVFGAALVPLVAGDHERRLSARRARQSDGDLGAGRHGGSGARARRSAAGSPTSRAGAGLSTSICPSALLSLFLALRFVPDSPRRQRRMDWIGFGCWPSASPGIQYFFDRGNQQDWFAAIDIRVAALRGRGRRWSAFVAHSLRRRAARIFDVRIFEDRNFGMSCARHAGTGVWHVRRPGAAAHPAGEPAGLSRSSPPAF